MKRSLLLQWTCLLASITCLGLPHLLRGNGLLLLLLPGIAGFWAFLHKRSAFPSASALLVMFVVLAAGGVLAEVSTPLMILGCTAALAWWDLTSFRESLVPGQPLETTLPLEKAHLQALALAVSGGSSLALVSSALDFRIPFIGMAFLALLATGCLLYGLRSLAKKN